jgi:glycolate oxidase FAD binding subunit
VSGEGLMEVGVSPPRLGDLARALEAGGLDYEARMGVGTCTVAIARAEDVAAVRAAATRLGGHAVVSDAPDALREDPWGPPPPGVHLMRRLRDTFDPAGILNRRQLLWA